MNKSTGQRVESQLLDSATKSLSPGQSHIYLHRRTNFLYLAMLLYCAYRICMLRCLAEIQLYNCLLGNEICQCNLVLLSPYWVLGISIFTPRCLQEMPNVAVMLLPFREIVHLQNLV